MSSTNRNNVSRTKQRENAFLVFYSNIFINGNDEILSSPQEVKNILQSLRPDESADDFLLELMDKTAKNSAIIRQKVQSSLKGWRIERLAKIDCSLLMLGTCEFFYLKDTTPLPVICNEYVELAKKYGHEGSSDFVNATLETIAKSVT